VTHHLTRQHLRQRPQSAGPQLTRHAYSSSRTADASCGATSSGLLLLTNEQQQQRRARPHTAGARTAAAATAPVLHKEHWPEWRNGQQQARHSALITRHCEHLHRSCKQRPLSAAAGGAGTVKHLTTAQQLQQARLRDTAQRRRRCAKAAHEALLDAEQEQRRAQSAARLRAQALWPQTHTTAAAAAAAAVKERPVSAQTQWRAHRPPLYDAATGRLIVTAIAPVAAVEAAAKCKPYSARPASANGSSSALYGELLPTRSNSNSSGSSSSSSGGITSSVRIHSRCHSTGSYTQNTAALSLRHYCQYGDCCC
jgi:hypothetical protein